MTFYSAPAPPPPPIPEPPRRRRRVPWIIAALLVVAGGATAAVLLLTGGGGKEHVKGGMELLTTDVDTTAGCSGTGGFDDIRDGADVEITDENGKTIAVTQLEHSAPIDGGCVLFWEADVPKGKDFYGVEITHRGVIKYTEAQLRKGVVQSLGD